MFLHVEDGTPCAWEETEAIVDHADDGWLIVLCCFVGDAESVVVFCFRIDWSMVRPLVSPKGWMTLYSFAVRPP